MVTGPRYTVPECGIFDVDGRAKCAIIGGHNSAKIPGDHREGQPVKSARDLRADANRAQYDMLVADGELALTFVRLAAATSDRNDSADWSESPKLAILSNNECRS